MKNEKGKKLTVYLVLICINPLICWAIFSLPHENGIFISDNDWILVWVKILKKNWFNNCNNIKRYEKTTYKFLHYVFLSICLV